LRPAAGFGDDGRMVTTSSGLGVRIIPRKLKRAVKKVAKKATPKRIATAALAPAILTTKLSAKVGKMAFRKATQPVRTRVQLLVRRRARKLSWDRRRSLQPNKAEVKEARGWAKSRLRARGPHGHMLALFAGGGLDAHDDVLLGALGAEPISTAAILAAVPVLAKLATVMIASLRQEAPPDPRAVVAAIPEETVAAVAEKAEVESRQIVQQATAQAIQDLGPTAKALAPYRPAAEAAAEALAPYAEEAASAAVEEAISADVDADLSAWDFGDDALIAWDAALGGVVLKEPSRLDGWLGLGFSLLAAGTGAFIAYRS
jgi:hypothetical protein